MTKTILVTGGAGYVGSHACKALAAAGYTPVSFDNLSNGHEWAVKWGPLVVGDVLNPDDLDAAFAAHKPVAVMHFAALIEVGESVKYPEKFHRTNVTGSFNVLKAMGRANVDRIVFSSTCAVHGDVGGALIKESSPIDPISPYAKTKAEVEGLLADFSLSDGLKAVALRYFNASGADPDGELGEAHDPESHLIPIACQAALGQRDGMFIYGDDYDTPDGTCLRDYIHVADLAEAHVKALKRLDGAVPGVEAFCLGGGVGTSVREVLDCVKKISGVDFSVKLQARRPGDAPSLVADLSKARTVLGWTPSHSDLTTIIKTAWAWHQKHHHH
ncbi:UDP-glucose 4-epimerase GalE [Magnetovibrio blakemorei]|uniref:UDP-glucose 4-epimerase n=1 Tax=Magnetovibrio blakemorei TaxID=28181 RepID=A0A1E5Q6N0_9PROT|nr:UDP-glucose 4-epimerase GalE [Magnetovibrio blakemorei]OEJ66679.1 UDP-glucose 4-epimerase GalE [Magnetovibrio blakemorei]